MARDIGTAGKPYDHPFLADVGEIADLRLGELAEVLEAAARVARTHIMGWTNPEERGALVRARVAITRTLAANPDPDPDLGALGHGLAHLEFGKDVKAWRCTCGQLFDRAEFYRHRRETPAVGPEHVHEWSERVCSAWTYTHPTCPDCRIACATCEEVSV